MNIKKKLKIEAERLFTHEDIKGRQVQDYALSIKFTDGHIHNVLPDDDQTRNEIVEDLISYT
ncbi:hypothetical protein KAR91_16195, partial [Candidatus Pacearchaeota archaeon]|nr:hypothetical protein [Candidatus Pacearchaeota archaeon]